MGRRWRVASVDDRAKVLEVVPHPAGRLPKFERLLTTALATWPKSTVVFREAMITWLNEKLWIKDRIRRQLAVPHEKVLFVEHHLSHAASAFFCSPSCRSLVEATEIRRRTLLGLSSCGPLRRMNCVHRPILRALRTCVRVRWPCSAKPAESFNMRGA